MKAAIYDTRTGEIRKTYYGSKPELQLKDGESFIPQKDLPEGCSDICHYVDLSGSEPVVRERPDWKEEQKQKEETREAARIQAEALRAISRERNLAALEGREMRDLEELEAVRRYRQP